MPSGALSCGGARLTGRDRKGRALVADGIKVGFDVFLDDGFAAVGAVSLLVADIIGMLSCRDARLTGCDDDGRSLAAYGMHVTGDVWLDGEFTASGEVSLRSTRSSRSSTCTRPSTGAQTGTSHGGGYGSAAPGWQPDSAGHSRPCSSPVTPDSSAKNENSGLNTHKSYDRRPKLLHVCGRDGVVAGSQETRRQVTWIAISRRQNWSI